MVEEILITAKPRDKTGHGSARRLRSSGFVPAVLYGKGLDTVHLLLSEKELSKTLSKVSGESVLMNLKIEDKKKKASSKEGASKPVIIKELQQDPVTNDILHIDFQVIRLTEKLKIKVPTHVKGEAPGVKAGGILDHNLREIEIECLPRDIPERIEMNISNLEIGDVIHIKDLAFPPGVVPVEDKEVSILSIVPPKVEEVEVVPEEEITEPEVIGKEKKEEEEGAEEAKEEAPKEEAPVKEKAKEKKPSEKPKPDQKK